MDLALGLLYPYDFHTRPSRKARCMRRRILDLADCSDSPLLLKSKHRHWGCKACWLDMCHAHGNHRVPGSAKIHRLTSDFFAGFSSTAVLGDMSAFVRQDP